MVLLFPFSLRMLITIFPLFYFVFVLLSIMELFLPAPAPIPIVRDKCPESSDRLGSSGLLHPEVVLMGTAAHQLLPRLLACPGPISADCWDLITQPHTSGHTKHYMSCALILSSEELVLACIYVGLLTQSLALNEGLVTLILHRKEASVSWGQLSSMRKASKPQRRRLHFSCAPLTRSMLQSHAPPQGGVIQRQSSRCLQT